MVTKMTQGVKRNKGEGGSVPACVKSSIQASNTPGANNIVIKERHLLFRVGGWPGGKSQVGEGKGREVGRCLRLIRENRGPVRGCTGGKRRDKGDVTKRRIKFKPVARRWSGKGKRFVAPSTILIPKIANRQESSSGRKQMTTGLPCATILYKTKGPVDPLLKFEKKGVCVRKPSAEQGLSKCAGIKRAHHKRRMK